MSEVVSNAPIIKSLSSTAIAGKQRIHLVVTMPLTKGYLIRRKYETLCGQPMGINSMHTAEHTECKRCFEFARKRKWIT